jgi:ribosomal protein L28
MRVDGVLSKNGSTSRSWEADLMQAAYLLEAEASRVKLSVASRNLTDLPFGGAMSTRRAKYIYGCRTAYTGGNRWELPLPAG